MNRKDFGIAFLTDVSNDRFLEAIRLAESADFGSFWIAESHYYRGMFSMLGELAALSSRVQLGVGVANPFARHPAIIAMEAATIDEITKGRLVLGLGSSRRMTLGFGIAASPLVKEKDVLARVSPLKAMRESVEIIRKLFAGDTLNFEGEVFRLRSPGAEAAGVSLGIEPFRRKIPIYIGASGPKMLDQTGEIGDGVLLTTLTSPGFVKYAVSQIRKGAERTNRNLSDIKIASYLLFSVSDDREKALEAVRNMIALYVTRVEPIVLEKGGLSSDAISRIEKSVREDGVAAAASRFVDKEMIRRFAVAGTPDDCLERLNEYSESGLEVPIGIQIIGPNLKLAIDLISNKILPELKD